jgi:hypothetical protein
VVALAGSIGCGTSNDRDAGAVGPDAGPIANGPEAAPFLWLNDGRNGVTHTTTVMGVVAENGAPVSIPAALGTEVPSGELQIMDSGGNLNDLFYTLPNPFSLVEFPGNQVQLVYAQLEQSFGSSYGVNLSDLSGNLVILAENGYVGPALSETQRLGFTFELDTQTPTLTDSASCGQRVHYRTIVSQSGVSRDLYPGTSAVFTVNNVDLTFYLLDSYIIMGNTCGTAPPYSIAYLVLPASS